MTWPEDNTVFSRPYSVGSSSAAKIPPRTGSGTAVGSRQSAVSSSSAAKIPPLRAAGQQTAVSSQQSAVFSLQSAVASPHGNLAHERKNMARRAIKIELPRLSSRGRSYSKAEAKAEAEAKYNMSAKPWYPQPWKLTCHGLQAVGAHAINNPNL